MRQAQHIRAYVSIGESRATLNGGLRRSFSVNSLLNVFEAPEHVPDPALLITDSKTRPTDWPTQFFPCVYPEFYRYFHLIFLRRIADFMVRCARAIMFELSNNTTGEN
jgi:hypothetical protein